MCPESVTRQNNRVMLTSLQARSPPLIGSVSPSNQRDASLLSKNSTFGCFFFHPHMQQCLSKIIQQPSSCQHFKKAPPSSRRTSRKFVLSSHQGNWAARTCSVFFNKRTYRRCHTSVRPLARRHEARRSNVKRQTKQALWQLDHDERLEQRSPHKWTNGYKWKYRQT